MKQECWLPLSPPQIPTLPTAARLCHVNLPSVNTARLRLNGPPGFEDKKVRYGLVLFDSDQYTYICILNTDVL